MSDLTRRKFLAQSVVAGAAVTLGEFAARDVRAATSTSFANTPSLAPTSPPPAPSWTDKPMRWAQLTLVEDDPQAGRFDLNFWLDYFARTKSDAVCLSAGGCVAYYPTKIPLHHRSAWLGDRDVFGELVAGCRKLGMVVVARTDPHATYDDAQRAHPDWIAVTADGQPRRHWVSPELWVTCGLGPYNFEFMREVHREIATAYRVDGIFINRWNGSGMCYCEHCRKNFRAATGLELPRTNNPQDPARRAYILWNQERLFELWQLWDGDVRAIKADACVIPNAGGGATSTLDMTRIGELAPTLMADHQARRGLMPPWANGKRGKEFRAALGRKPIVGIFSVGLEEPYRWKDSVQNAAEIRLWAIDGIANGLRPWFTKFAGTIADPRWLKPVEQLYVWCAAHERYLRNERSLARVALVYSQQTAWFHVAEHGGRESIEDAANGWYHALIEARIPFEMVHDRRLDAAHLADFKTLILPNIVALSDAQCAQLREFVRRGGSVIATSETSLADEWGVKRKDFALADLFGASFGGKVDGPMHNAYLRLEHEAAKNHPLLADLEDAPRIIHGAWRVEVVPHEKSAAPLTLIPSYPDLPMEKVFARTPRTDIAQVFLREVGERGGRVVYFPWDIDRTFWEILDLDHGRLLRNAVAWATNEPAPVTVDGPGILDVTLWRQANSVAVHLVNLTNPMMMKGPIREAIPVGEQRVRVRLAEGASAKAVRFLVAGTTPDFRQSGEWLEVVVPSVVEHEVVAIDV
ncbi:MAG TPA: beta-galactosidase trimerization domain-containing protein [Opitutaceae bacterium]|nr:beta-galactosidase trimerization domain-containing protein [Opitutaceae bacterium]